VPQDRKMRIEVGYGLEGTLTDVASSRIIRNVMTPQFKAGNYDKGIDDGVVAVIAQLEGQADAIPAQTLASTTSSSSSSFHFDTPDMPWPVRILLGAFIFGIIGLFTFVGIVTPGAGWFLYAFLIPFWAMFPIIIVGVRGALVLLVTYVVGFPIGKLIVSRQPWYEKAQHELKTKGATHIGGFAMSTGSGSSSWSSSSSSSGGGYVYRQPEPVRHTKRDAVIGAVAGAAIGQAIGRDTKGTLIGAGVGAVVGGIIGHTIDVKQP